MAMGTATVKQESLAQQLRRLPRRKAERFVTALSPLQAAALKYDWSFWARPAQQYPAGTWPVWLIKTGRGWGKNRTGAETVRMWAETPNLRIALGGKKPDDYRSTMIEGEAGLLTICPPWNRPKFYPSHSPPVLVWPNGAQAFCYSGETPDDLRGPAHHKAWIDELAKFKYPDQFWDNLMLGLRLGENPQVLVTTTPRPIKLLKQLLKHPLTYVTHGTTYENLDNLAPTFRAHVLSRYEGTRLGRQELAGELLGDTPGALWTMTTLDQNRRTEHPPLQRIVVAVDPSANDGQDEQHAEAGIIVGGLDSVQHGYCLEDCSLRGTPTVWAKAAIAAFHEHQADLLIAEGNNGGEMVRTTIHAVDPRVPVKIIHASRGKYVRAEPISTFDEQGRLHLVGSFKELEDQLTTWVPGMRSPDRLDAYVWVFTELLGAYATVELSGGGEPEPLVAVPHGAQLLDPSIAAGMRNGLYWP